MGIPMRLKEVVPDPSGAYYAKFVTTRPCRVGEVKKELSGYPLTENGSVVALGADSVKAGFVPFLFRMQDPSPNGMTRLPGGFDYKHLDGTPIETVGQLHALCTGILAASTEAS